MGTTLRNISWALLAKASIVTSAILTYTFHDEIKKVDYNIFEKRTEIQESFYNNPPVLDIEWKTNDDGFLETYMINQQTKKKVEVMYDMLPKNSTMVEAIKTRISDGYQEEGFKLESLEEVVKYQNQENKPANLWDKVVDYFSNKN